MCSRAGLCSDAARFQWSVLNTCYTEAFVRRGRGICVVDIFVASAVSDTWPVFQMPRPASAAIGHSTRAAGRGKLKRYFVYSFRQSWPLFGNPPGEANPCLKRLPFARTLEYNAQKLQPINVKSLVMPSSCHALESSPQLRVSAHTGYFATAALRTCVLKKPPLVRSITCW